jgi:hypothetical protein
MKLLKMFGLAALTALMAMAFAGAGSAMAESTALCEDDPGDNIYAVCDDFIEHVHETTLASAQAKILSSVIDVECDVLFLGSALAALATNGPMLIHGSFTYTNCGVGCTVFEENGPGDVKVLKTSHETASVTYAFQIHVECWIFIDCKYNGVGLTGTGKGPLLSSEINGGVTLTEQVLNRVGGSFCPATAKLDITTTPLKETYITT